MKVGIIMLNLNTKEYVLQILDDIGNQSFGDWHVYLVDNGSEIENRITSSEIYSSRVSLTIINDNTGFAEGNNIGMRKAIADGCEYIWILNNDTRLENSTLERMTTYLDENEDVAAICPKIMYESERSNLWYAGGIVDFNKPYPFNVCRHRGERELDVGQYDEIEDTQFLTGCSTFIRSSVLQKVGLYDSRYFAYYEDADLSQKIISNGFAIQYYPEAKLFHMVGMLNGPQSPIPMYYQIRNWWLFVMSYGTIRAKFLAMIHMKWLLFKNVLKILMPTKRVQARAQLRACYHALAGQYGGPVRL